MLCAYANKLGEPNKGVHRHFLGLAIFDLLGTVLIALAIAHYSKVNFWLIFGIIFLLGVVLHRMFCVNTTVNKLIFGQIAEQPITGRFQVPPQSP